MKKLIFFLTIGMLLISVTAALAASVTPTVIPGGANTDKACAVVMPGTTELKIDNMNGSGPYAASDGVLSVNVVKPSAGSVNPNSLDWTSNIPVSGVIVKDGTDGANWYDYSSNPSVGDTYLTTPFDGAKGVSHVSWCYYPPVPLTAEKTAAGTYDRTVSWTLVKTVDDDSHTGEAGEIAGNSIWTVVADKTVALGNYQVTGTITVYNPNAYPVNFSISDTLNDGAIATVTCPVTGNNTGTVPKKVNGVNGQVTCSYTASPSGSTATLNTATVTSTTTGVNGAVATAPVSFTENKIGYDSGTLSDARFNYSETVNDDKTKAFPETFTCPSDPNLYTNGQYSFTETNTAVLNGNINLSASEDVTVTCTLPALDVTKTAAGTYDRTVTWTLDKTVDDNSHTGLAGSVAGSSIWTVVADKTEVLDNYVVTGTITVDNPAAIAQTFTISDVLDDGTVASVTCDTYTIPAGGTTTCSYTANPTGGTATENTVTVSAPGNADQSANASIAYVENLKGYDAGTLSDSRFGYSEIISADTTKNFPEDFTCPSDLSMYTNGKYSYTETNTAVLNGQINLQDSADVTVNCYSLLVTKTATTSFTRTWTWDIEKTGDQTDLTLSLGQQFLVNYTVVVDASSADSAWAVAGEIHVNNPAPIDATLNGVNDIVSDGIAATVDCGVTFPYTLASGETLTCDYTAVLPDAADRTNTATATIQNAPSGTTDFTGSAQVLFGSTPTVETDECIDVTDDKGGVLGTVCADDAPEIFTYSLYVGPYDVCGDYTFVNVASFVTNDTDATGSDDHTVNVSVPCATGCTLTQGYWKTHSEFGPAPYDDTWAMLPNGANTIFYSSGHTWYGVFWTPPAGNVYFNLAHQYMAAYMNVLNGASTTPEVDAAMANAETFFTTYTPSSKFSKAQRTLAMQLASTLDKYNNGLIGPGHCSE